MKTFTTLAIAFAMVASTAAIASPNPASVFCTQTLGGTLSSYDPHDTSKLACELTINGKTLKFEEWKLFHAQVKSTTAK